jgi:hypothetical protein
MDSLKRTERRVALVGGDELKNSWLVAAETIVASVAVVKTSIRSNEPGVGLFPFSNSCLKNVV